MNDGGPAFPALKKLWNSDRDIKASNFTAEVIGGMSLRDWFAGQIVPNLFNGHEFSIGREGFQPEVYEHIATQAYRFADAMLKAREK
jgi:hypothetical protein